MNLFDIDKIEAELKELENQTIQEGFWNDSKTSSKVLTRIKQLKSKCTSFRKIETEIQNMQELTELVELEPDEDVAKDILKNTKKIEKELEKLEDAIAFRNIANMPARVKCALLAWHTMEDMLNKDGK